MPDEGAPSSAAVSWPGLLSWEQTMYLITALDPKTHREILISTNETASAAIVAYAAASEKHPDLQIEAAPDGYINHDELARRAAFEAVGGQA